MKGSIVECLFYNVKAIYGVSSYINYFKNKINSLFLQDIYIDGKRD